MKNSYAGVDGCPSGWLGIQLNRGGQWAADLFPDATSLWQRFQAAKLILIDIPIGLPDRKIMSRECDQEARRLLGWPRSSSVFPCPARAATDSLDYANACERNQTEVGKRLSMQTFCILDKVRQVDDLLRREPAARPKMREIHPELCFWAFNGKNPMRYRKSKHDGFNERMRVLSTLYPGADRIVSEILDRYPRSQVRRDDVLDALVAAITASESENLLVIPKFEQRDARGLRMEMVYRHQG